MSYATQEFVNERLVPMEGTLRSVKDSMDAAMVKLESRDADWNMMEIRMEEVALKVKEMEAQLQKLTDESC